MADENTQDQEPDFLSMSDEELLNFNTSGPSTPNQEEKPVAELTDKEAEEYGGAGPVISQTDEEIAAAAAALHDDDLGDGNEDDAKNDVAGGTSDASGKADKAAATSDATAPTDAKAASDESGKEKTVGEGEAKPDGEAGKGESATFDYKTAYENLTKGKIKANGREIQLKGEDDIIRLAQMGVDYNKKMAAMKPSIKLMKMLEQAELLDEGKLNFLIDLHRGDKAAINRLVSNNKIDPLDLSAEQAEAYQPGDHSVSENSIALDEVLDELRGSEHYSRTVQVVGQQWDEKSRGVVAANPQVVKLINGHIAAGYYDIITEEIERERTFGRLKDMSDIEAYRQVGDAIHARGGFNHLEQGSSPAQKATTPPATVVEPKPKQADDANRKDKRKAAAPTKAAAPAKAVTADFNPLAMSDEDFAKFKPR